MFPSPVLPHVVIIMKIHLGEQSRAFHEFSLKMFQRVVRDLFSANPRRWVTISEKFVLFESERKRRCVRSGSFMRAQLRKAEPGENDDVPSGDLLWVRFGQVGALYL